MGRLGGSLPCEPGQAEGHLVVEWGLWSLDPSPAAVTLPLGDLGELPNLCEPQSLPCEMGMMIGRLKMS